MYKISKYLVSMAYELLARESRHIVVCIFLVYAFTTGIFAGSTEMDVANAPSRSERKLGLSMALGGPGGLYSISLDYYVLPYLDIEIGGAAYPWVKNYQYTSYAGLRYAFLGHMPRQKWTPFIGAYVTSVSNKKNVTFFTQTDAYEEAFSSSYLMAYFSAGTELIAFDGFTFSAEVAYSPTTGDKRSVQSSRGQISTAGADIDQHAWFSLRWGYHFKSN